MSLVEVDARYKPTAMDDRDRAAIKHVQRPLWVETSR